MFLFQKIVALDQVFDQLMYTNKSALFLFKKKKKNAEQMIRAEKLYKN